MAARGERAHLHSFGQSQGSDHVVLHFVGWQRITTHRHFAEQTEGSGLTRPVAILARYAEHLVSYVRRLVEAIGREQRTAEMEEPHTRERSAPMPQCDSFCCLELFEALANAARERVRQGAPPGERAVEVSVA